MVQGLLLLSSSAGSDGSFQQCFREEEADLSLVLRVGLDGENFKLCT